MNNYNTVEYVSLGTCIASTPVVDWTFRTITNHPCNQNQEEGNTPMCYAAKTAEVNESTILRDERKFLLDQLEDARHKFYGTFHKAFHMEPVGPTSIGEMIEWIKADKFEMDANAKKNGYIGDFTYHCKWVDKANPPDEAGYMKAKEAMEKAYNDALRVIRIKDAVSGLDALTAFENATFH